MNAKRNVLGRGIDSLIPGANAPARSTRNALPVQRITPNPDQPRKTFDQAKIEELAASIKAVGLLQSIVVRPSGDAYLIVAGERRFRACKLLGWQEIPATIQDLDDVQGFTAALIENLQREDLNSLEEARGFSELIDAGNLTQKEASQKLGISRSALTNKLRLLTLPGSVQVYIESGRLSEGHGRALLGIDTDRIEEVAQWAVENNATVRQVEQLGKKRHSTANTKTTPSSLTADLQHWQRTMEQKISTKVTVKPKPSGQGGQIVLSYTDDADFNRISEILNRG